MPHYTCASCRIRHRTSGAPAVADLCPQCGSRLQPTAELEGLVGYQSIGRLDDRAGAVTADPHQNRVACLDEFSARHRQLRERFAFDAEPWDDGDASVAMSAALPLAQRFR